MAGRRVLLVSGQAERYGADRSLLTLAKGLAARGWQIAVVVPDDGPLVRDLCDARIAVHRVDPGVVRRALTPGGWLRLLVSFPLTVWRLRRLARDADLVHVNAVVVVGALVGARAARRPVVCHLRESFAAHPRAARALGLLLRATATRVIAVSTAIAEEASSVGLASRTVVIHNSCDLPADAGPTAPRSDGSARVLQVGRINDWKGQGVLVDALAVLAERGLVVEADLAGDVFPGAEVHRERLLERVREHGLDAQVHLLGFVDDVAPLMQPAGIFVQPSTRPEPFGLALVEAMSRKMACIATRAGGPLEIVRDGVTGVLVPPGDARALADAIERLWRDGDLRVRLGEAAAADVVSRFSPDREVERCEALYREVLGG